MKHDDDYMVDELVTLFFKTSQTVAPMISNTLYHMIADHSILIKAKNEVKEELGLEQLDAKQVSDLLSQETDRSSLLKYL